ncbi:hypothetical protein [Lewinella sp. IMCC34183]|uniref:hypothetical protein n=1 Tax=Lewinella sp. IMCC34183 TaxID=2248762 RepID=UPI0013002039|nr:hypothetical protein [Lewinella sp. IMCC34183]
MKKIWLSLLILSIVTACNDPDQKDQTIIFEESNAGYGARENDYSEIGYEEIKYLLSNYRERKGLLKKYEFYMRRSGRNFDSNCESEVYNVVRGNNVMFDTPYIEICDCCNENMVWVTFSGSSRHKMVYDRVMDSAINDGYSEPYIDEYDDGTFLKEYSKKDFALTASSQIMKNDSFAYEVMLMLFLPK